MSTKKSQRRFMSEREIIAEINNCQRAIDQRVKLAEENEDKGHQYIRTGEPGLVEQGKMMLEDGERNRRNAKRMEDNRLKKLKNALAAFRTELLPGMGADNAVVLEKFGHTR